MTIPHCPNPECSCFSDPPGEKWYIRYGYHHTKAFKTVQRFKCKHCGTTFSTQTFHIDFYAKKVVDYQQLIEQLVTASGLLDITRQMHIRPECIQNRFERLTRCFQAIHSDLLAQLPLTEDFVADGFETFSRSQYYPNHVNILVGKKSEFVYTLGFANLRRKGRMTKEQKEKRQRLEQEERANPKAIEQSMRTIASDMVQRLIEKGISQTTLYTDEHKAYLRGFGKIPAFPEIVHHVRIASTDKKHRALDLLAVDYMDRQFRKDLSDHARETIQFAKCPSAQMARLAVYRFYHNCCIARRVKEYRKGNNETHVERAGIDRHQVESIIDRHWGKRAFLQKTALCSEEVNTWLCAWRNPGIDYGRYIPKYIAA